jgi:DNA-binding NarL/FixJ family response regulator
LAWAGCARDAVELVARVDAAAADVVILDVDMPVRDTMEALAELTRLRPNVRVVMLSGHVRRDLIERALDKGAMGYISKIEEPGVIIEAVRAAARGEIALSPESQRALARG